VRAYALGRAPVCVRERARVLVRAQAKNKRIWLRFVCFHNIQGASFYAKNDLARFLARNRGRMHTPQIVCAGATLPSAYMRACVRAFVRSCVLACVRVGLRACVRAWGGASVRACVGRCVCACVRAGGRVGLARVGRQWLRSCAVD
jgi:hypothetical protein